MSSCLKQPNNRGRMRVLVVDVVELAEDRTLGKPAEDKPTAEPTKGGARVRPWWMVWTEPGD